MTKFTIAEKSYLLDVFEVNTDTADFTHPDYDGLLEVLEENAEEGYLLDASILNKINEIRRIKWGVPTVKMDKMNP